MVFPFVSFISSALSITVFTFSFTACISPPKSTYINPVFLDPRFFFLTPVFFLLEEVFRVDSLDEPDNVRVCDGGICKKRSMVRSKCLCEARLLLFGLLESFVLRLLRPSFIFVFDDPSSSWFKSILTVVLPCYCFFLLG